MANDALLIATMHHRRVALSETLKRVGWNLTVYGDVSEALAHVRERPYAAVFCDEYLRGASAGGFLAWSRRVAPKRPFYVIAMRGTEASLGAGQDPDRVLPFPLDDADAPLPATQTVWDGPPAAQRDLPMEGTTGLVPLSDLIEMLALTGASAVVTLGEGRVGRVYLREGQLEHAVCAGDSDTLGVRGLGRLLDLGDTPFQVLPYRNPSRRTIHVSTVAALTEAARLIDEQRRDRQLLDAVRAGCPDVLGVAAGYVLNDAPAEVVGDGCFSFTSGAALIEAVKGTAVGVSHLAIEADGHAHAVVVYGEGHMLAAHAARGRSLVLLSALAKAIKRQGVAAH